jgi:prepilin signal peptidase PulO-like enzyme (type II secretory pathway)
VTRVWSWADRISLTALTVSALGVVGLTVIQPWTWERGAMALAALVAVWAGVLDLRTARVPNALTLPLMGLGLGTSLVRVGWGALPWTVLGVVALAWVACVLVWGLRLFGGGDVKLSMGLLALAPSLEHIVALSLALTIGLGLYLTLDRRSGRWCQVGAIVTTATLGRALPDRAEIEQAYRTRATPVAPWIAIGYIAYLLSAVR